VGQVKEESENFSSNALKRARALFPDNQQGIHGGVKISAMGMRVQEGVESRWHSKFSYNI
jgi:hypothetical protein